MSQAIRLKDRSDTRRMILLGSLAGIAFFALVVMAVTSKGFFADSLEQSAFNSCVDEAFYTSRNAGTPFNWSQVQLSCTNRAINTSSNRLR